MVSRQEGSTAGERYVPTPRCFECPRFDSYWETSIQMGGICLDDFTQTEIDRLRADVRSEFVPRFCPAAALEGEHFFVVAERTNNQPGDCVVMDAEREYWIQRKAEERAATQAVED